ncbi:Hypothetical predicted protein [Pelobates cultripes]|uniref:Uncharacterized protein n=1 Tax=Pelobates cultripes TaxID=61616 RepID=A0AAD1SD33_PELCU|nr:Hypothetical predicted protein [Pelobates cultripes]
MVSKQNKALTPIKHLMGSSAYCKEGQFLSIDEEYNYLKSERDLHEVGSAIISKISKLKFDQLFKMCLVFAITRLRHVTTQDCLPDILSLGYFNVNNSESSRRLCFWSAEVIPDDIEQARQWAFDYVQHMVTAEEAERFQEEIKGQFASSPAFDNSTSRYGNFMFSFALSDLLEAYQPQHCQNGEPQLRVLGTEMYTQEIAHIVVVHSPDTDLYHDLPRVETVPSTAESLPFIYRPESVQTVL